MMRKIKAKTYWKVPKTKAIFHLKMKHLINNLLTSLIGMREKRRHFLWRHSQSCCQSHSIPNQNFCRSKSLLRSTKFCSLEFRMMQFRNVENYIKVRSGQPTSNMWNII